MKSRNEEVHPVLLGTRALGLSYRGVPAFCDVNLAVPAQRITALIGPSGCGKTSFLSCLNRLTDLIPGAQVRGAASLCGDNILDPRMDLIGLRRRVGMIFQKPNPFPLSIRRNIELALVEHGMRDRAERAHTVERVLREVGLWDEVHDRLDRPAQTLSGGQQQRLCIARALALRPEVLLMDEPCSALDPLSSGVVEDLILRLKAHYTVVIVTHNLQQARRIADFTGVFWTEQRCGRLIEFGATEQVFNAPQDPRAAAYVQGLRG
jgi:phosphate transport system ATP-binding protein